MNSYEKSRLSHYGIDADNFEGGMQEIFEARREEKLFQKLMSEGRYAELDKAKHNKGYRSYLLSNLEDDDPFGRPY